jgi:hypothetical protein
MIDLGDAAAAVSLIVRFIRGMDDHGNLDFLPLSVGQL